MDELRALRSLARAMGVQTRYTDGLRRHVKVEPETLLRVCAALGAPLARTADAAEALRYQRAVKHAELLPPVLVAWDGILAPVAPRAAVDQAELRLEDGSTVPLARDGGGLRVREALPHGYHRLTVEAAGRVHTITILAAPVQTFRRPGSHRSWGVGTELAALRSARSRSLGDLADLEAVCRWIKSKGGDLVTVLPLYPTFNTEPAEPSPYSPVSRLFWSELILDLGDAHRPAGPQASLDVRRAHAEVWQALANRAVPQHALQDQELVRYALFRGAQERLGRNWRAWPPRARAGQLEPDQVDQVHEGFHLVAQSMVHDQLTALRQRLDRDGIRLGLDLAVGVHPDGYDPWSRQGLFCDGMSVGAPPDGGFPSGQDWGFSPVLPDASRREGHQYLAASIAHQAELAGVLRVDHIMAWTRLYWIPHGLGLHQGTYVSYPAEELFALLTLESNRKRCEVVGENLGTVPREIFEALPRHRIWGMYLAQFEAGNATRIKPPPATDVALIGTHDTPPFAGWITGTDIPERVHYGLLTPDAAVHVKAARDREAEWLAKKIGANVHEPAAFLALLLDWLGRSDSPLVAPWIEDLWLENVSVNLPGTRSSVRPNWQRPMRLLLDEAFQSPEIAAVLQRLDQARHAHS